MPFGKNVPIFFFSRKENTLPFLISREISDHVITPDKSSIQINTFLISP